MSTKVEKERAKQIQDKCLVLLNQMLKDEDNKYCVDCDAKGPRWASWNIGIFLCIRCAGIHRNLGVHISKVKSVNLDSWTPEQVVSLQQMGNSRARAVYEANLPDDFRRPYTDSALEQFIRAKYESKKYIAREWVPPAIPKVNWDKELDEEAERQKRKKRESKQQANPIPNIRSVSSVIPQPLPKPVSTSPKPNRTKVNPSPPADLLGLDTPFANSGSGDKQNNKEPDLFSNFLSITPSPSVPNSSSSNSQTASDKSSSKRTAEEESFFNQPTSTSPAKTKQQLSTDSILALYSKSQVNPPQFPSATVQGGMFGTMQPLSTSGYPNSEFMMPNGISSSSNPVPQNDFFGGVTNTVAPALGIPNPAAPASGISNPVSSLNIVSNPFYNLSGGFPGSNPVSRLPQQLGGMSLGVSTSQSTQMSAPQCTPQSASLIDPMLQAQQTPMINRVFNMQPQQSLNPLGQTLSSKLWQ